jgi:hypothetical protein
MDKKPSKERGSRVIEKARVIVEIVGGLGNQMFQYAAARSLAERLETSVGLDLRRFDTYCLRKPALHHLQIDAKPMLPQEMRRYPQAMLQAAGRLPPAIRQWLGCYREPSLAFDRGFESLGRPLHLSGYFQSERYFYAIRDTLQSEFVPTDSLNEPNASLIMHMQRCNSVSLHVRRGDYVTVLQNQHIHGSCSPAYYQRAIDVMQTEIGPATWFVFSDDIDWVRLNLPLPTTVVYVEGNIDRPEWDIHLMAQCRHNICANSSFSWWGAWLNNNPNKRVIVPAVWFATQLLDASDIVPTSWIRVPN